MNELQQLMINIATGVILAFGAYYSYKGHAKGRAPSYRYVFLFFLITLFTQVIGLMQILVAPQLPSVNPIFWLRLSQISFVTIRIAYVVLALHCYATTRDRINGASGA